MPFNIAAFRAEMERDGARGNLFEVAMTFPGFSDPSAAQKLTFMCKASQLPGSQVGVIEVPYFGRKIKLAGDRNFAEWDMTIINDEDFKVRTAFERWMNGLNSHRFNLRNPAAESSDGYTQDATITQYGHTGDILRQYAFIGAWPTAVSPIEVAWEDQNTIEQFGVTLAYQWWETVELGII